MKPKYQTHSLTLLFGPFRSHSCLIAHPSSCQPLLVMRNVLSLAGRWVICWGGRSGNEFSSLNVHTQLLPWRLDSLAVQKQILRETAPWRSWGKVYVFPPPPSIPSALWREPILFSWALQTATTIRRQSSVTKLMNFSSWTYSRSFRSVQNAWDLVQVYVPTRGYFPHLLI